jgi:hypothetical protein
MAIAGPRDLQEFAVTDGTGVTLWAISADPPQTPVSLYYGIVPAGFVQNVPVSGTSPRALILGEPLTTRTLTARFLFTHQGVAASEHRLLVLNHAMERLRPKSPEP